MPADFSFVADSAQAHARELATERICNRLAEAGFTHTWRAKKAKDRPSALRIQFSNSKIFDQSAFDFFEPVMIAIEDLLSLVKIEIVLTHLLPRQIGKRFQRS